VSVVRGNEWTNCRRATGATSLPCSVGDDERHGRAGADTLTELVPWPLRSAGRTTTRTDSLSMSAKPARYWRDACHSRKRHDSNGAGERSPGAKCGSHPSGFNRECVNIGLPVVSEARGGREGCLQSGALTATRRGQPRAAGERREAVNVTEKQPLWTQGAVIFNEPGRRTRRRRRLVRREVLRWSGHRRMRRLCI